MKTQTSRVRVGWKLITRIMKVKLNVRINVSLSGKVFSRILGVSESRVSQLHTKSLKKMKEKLGDENMGVFSILNI